MAKEKLFYWNRFFREYIRIYIEENDPLFLQEYDITLKEEATFGEKIHPRGTLGYGRSLVDRKGEHVFTINPVINFSWQEDEYYSEMDNYTFSEVMIETAKWVSSSGKTIDFFWSGGTDSNAALLALNEVCPKQLHVIIGESHECPEIYEKIVKHLDHHIDKTANLFAKAQPDKHILCTMAEADFYFGSYGASRVGLPPKIGWETRRRFTFCGSSMRFFTCFAGDKLDTDNIKPFCGGPLLEKWMINYVKNDKMVFYYDFYPADAWPKGKDRFDENNWINCKGQEHYKKCKMPLRDFIYEMTGNKEIAYNNIKLAGQLRAFHGSVRGPKPRVLAVIENGDIIHTDNINDYNLFNFLKDY